MKFAHIADCHLGSWRQPELQQLNLESFKKAIENCIQENVNFILFSGDLFDSAYPPIEILKETFSEFRKLKESKIKCYVISGSHDYSVSGKTFLDVLEKAGFCEICKFEEQKTEKANDEKNEETKDEKSDSIKNILLKPLNHEGFSIYGYPGKKSGLEVEDLRKVFFEETNNFRILMLHTTMESARGTLPIDSVDINDLPKADYYALGHLHLVHEYKISDNKYLIYPGPIFPNNFQELEDLKSGSFYIVEVNGYVKLTKKELKTKSVLLVEIEIENALTATNKILAEIDKQDLQDKIILLRLKGKLKQGKTSDINFQEIQEKIKQKGAYVFLKNTSKLKTEELEMEIETGNIEKIEETILEGFIEKNPSQFNRFISSLVDSLDLEKQEDEKSAVFESRLLGELNKILNLDMR